VIVVDTSAWIEFFRASGGAVHQTLRRLLRERGDLAVTEVVVMELLAGARSQSEAEGIRSRLVTFPVLTLGGLGGFESAAALYRSCRAAGETLRSLTDCLVAVPAIEAGATLLHADNDFDVLARHTPLQIEPLSA
jgi:predicted nucleic acid-binding protein